MTERGPGGATRPNCRECNLQSAAKGCPGKLQALKSCTSLDRAWLGKWEGPWEPHVHHTGAAAQGERPPGRTASSSLRLLSSRLRSEEPSGRERALALGRLRGTPKRHWGRCRPRCSSTAQDDTLNPFLPMQLCQCSVGGGGGVTAEVSSRDGNFRFLTLGQASTGCPPPTPALLLAQV